MEFPCYRKYLNNKSYFKISSPAHFEELKITGKYFSLELVETKTLPERNFISDMLFDFVQSWQEIQEAEYEEKKQFCLLNLKRIQV